MFIVTWMLIKRRLAKSNTANVERYHEQTLRKKNIILSNIVE